MKYLKSNNILILSTLLLLLGCTHKGGFSSISDDVSSAESYIEPISSETSEEIYDEPIDSTDGIDTSDLSALYSAFSSIHSYGSEVKTYFNEVGAHDYWRHYQKNYVPQMNSIFNATRMYSYTTIPEYFDSLNEGFINKSGSYYKFSLPGNTIEERMSYELQDSDLTLAKSGNYQDDVFMLDDLNQSYLTSKNFTRISEKKYETREIDALEEFVAICAPKLINTGHYMTFSRVTIELNPVQGVAFRIRLYASATQSGKLIESHLDQANKPNWYLLFSEAEIYL